MSRINGKLSASPVLCDFLYGSISKSTKLTHRPAMPFGNRTIYFRGSFQFSIVTMLPSGNPNFNYLGIL